MTDIVERLLRYEAETDPEVSQLAADEIERLRGLLREFLAAHDSYEVHKRIRETLGDE
jgi:hypothetical protein